MARDLQLNLQPGSSGKPTETMKLNSIANLIGASAVALFFTACDSKQENLREDALEQKADGLEKKADMTRDNGEKSADAAEEVADKVRKTDEVAADQTEQSAEATRKATEARADALEKEAEKTREQK